MTWLRWHVGAVADAKMRAVAREAGTGATPGHCIAVWAALLEHAALQRPRGLVENFDAVACANSFEWPHDLVRRIMHAMMVVGLHDFTRLHAWDKRNPPDSTSAARQKLWRDRHKMQKSNNNAVTESEPDTRNGVTVSSNAVTKSAPETRNGVTVSSNAVTKSDVETRNGVTVSSNAVTKSAPETRNGVTVSPLSRARAEKALALDVALKAPGSFCSTTSTPNSNSPVPASGIRARASEPNSKLSTGDVWNILGTIGIKPGMFGRFGSGASITNWIERGLTADDLGEAIARARRARERNGDASPIGLRYLACFIEDVLSGQPERGKLMSWIERGDAIGRAWLEGRT